MDGEADRQTPQYRSPARKLGTVGLVGLTCVAVGWTTTVCLAARARTRIHPLVALKNRIDANAQRGRVFTRNVPAGSTGGGNLTAWIYKGKVQKLALTLFGTTSEVRNTYYLSGRWLVCVEKEQWRYNRPITSHSLSGRPLKRAKTKQEEYYLATGVGLHRATPKSRLVTLSASGRKSAERKLTQECANAARILKTRGQSSKPAAPKGVKSKRSGSGRPSNSLASAASRRR